MLSISDFTMQIDGLIAYYPLLGGGDDKTGNGFDLTEVNPSLKPYYNGKILLSSLLPSYGIKIDQEIQGDYIANYLRGKQSPNTKCVSIFIQFPTDLNLLGTAFSLNGVYTDENLVDRINFGWRFRELHVGDGYGGSDSYTGFSVDEYEGEIVHFLAQENENGTGYDIFINGKVVYQNTSNPVFSRIIDSDDRYFVVGSHTFKRQGSHATTWCSECSIYSRRLTGQEIMVLYGYIKSNPVAKVLLPNNIIWGNKESKIEANQYPIKVQSVLADSSINLIGKSNGYLSMLNSMGDQRPIGYYKSSVLVNNENAPYRKVMCFTNNGLLVDETISDSNGDYRFDHLDLNKKYMFVAQYSNEPNTPPDYTAVAADWQSPTPYKE